MWKEKFFEDLKIINNYIKNLNSWLKDLFQWVAWDNQNYKEVLDEYLDFIWIESNEETRLCAYFRIVNSSENSLIMYMEKNHFSDEKKEDILDISISYVWDFYKEIQDDLISFINSKKLLTPFYREVFNWTHNVWLAFNKFFPLWRKYIINFINKDLEKKFENDSEKIMSFLEQEKLLDLGHNWEIADRTYSVLVKNSSWKYESKSYREVFSDEVNEIIHELNNFAWNLEKLEDELFMSKKAYLDYLNSLIDALKELDVNNLVQKWTKVDEYWMQIKTPIQIVHPCEYYEDKYRRAVSPDWDLRIKNEIFDSKINLDVLEMYEKLYDWIWRDKYQESYKFSLDNLNKVQLYLSNQVLFYAAFFTSKYSAQVLPNDPIASEKFGKKIYALPEDILEDRRKRPFMKLSSIIFDENLLDEHRKYIFWKDEIFYNVYDIETIGHEYWHNLWMTKNTEIVMNEKTWVFKNIEEFKATSGWLVSYFMSWKYDDQLDRKIIIDQLFRAIGLLSYKKINDTEPYYCESLIFLTIIFQSWLVVLDNKKVKLNWNIELYNNFKDLYIKNYKELINIYINKMDAWKFLFEFMARENWYFLPTNNELKSFVNYYYEMYEKYWNEIDKSVDKTKYIN